MRPAGRSRRWGRSPRAASSALLAIRFVVATPHREIRHVDPPGASDLPVGHLLDRLAVAILGVFPFLLEGARRLGLRGDVDGDRDGPAARQSLGLREDRVEGRPRRRGDPARGAHGPRRAAPRRREAGRRTTRRTTSRGARPSLGRSGRSGPRRAWRTGGPAHRRRRPAWPSRESSHRGGHRRAAAVGLQGLFLLARREQLLARPGERDHVAAQAEARPERLLPRSLRPSRARANRTLACRETPASRPAAGAGPPRPRRDRSASGRVRSPRAVPGAPGVVFHHFGSGGLQPVGERLHFARLRARRLAIRPACFASTDQPHERAIPRPADGQPAGDRGGGQPSQSGRTFQWAGSCLIGSGTARCSCRRPSPSASARTSPCGRPAMGAAEDLASGRPFADSARRLGLRGERPSASRKVRVAKAGAGRRRPGAARSSHPPAAARGGAPRRPP